MQQPWPALKIAGVHYYRDVDRVTAAVRMYLGCGRIAGKALPQRTLSWRLMLTTRRARSGVTTLNQLLYSAGIKPYFSMTRRENLFGRLVYLSLIHISEPTRLGMISYAVFCLKKKKK